MGGNDNRFESKTTFVTVGTTFFDSLVEAVDTEQVKQALLKKGYTHLVIQMGRGSYIPQKYGGEDGLLVVDYFTFSPSIADYMRSASLVISHAGSGSIFETFKLVRTLIVTVNEDLWITFRVVTPPNFTMQRNTMTFGSVTSLINSTRQNINHKSKSFEVRYIGLNKNIGSLQYPKQLIP